MIEGLNDVPGSYSLRFGTLRAKDFPADANLRMNKDFPKAQTLTDALDNTERLFVASARLVQMTGV